MSEKPNDTKNEEQNPQTPGEEEETPNSSDGGQTPEGDGENKLEEATQEELVEYAKRLRSENATRRKKATDLQSTLDELQKKVKELEDEKKSDEEKESDRIAGLEAAADRVPDLERYHAHVEAELKGAMKEIEAMKAEAKRPFLDALKSFKEDDLLGRLSIIRTIKAVAKQQDTIQDGDETNPNEPGGGASEKGIASKLGWSPSGMDEAKLAGMI